MDDPINLMRELQDDRHLMKEAVKEASKRGIDYAQKEAAYYAAKAKAAVKLKADGENATMIGHILKGQPEVTQAMYEALSAEALWRAAREAINVYRDDARIVYDQIKRAQQGDPEY